jgi:hypothetical protein
MPEKMFSELRMVDKASVKLSTTVQRSKLSVKNTELRSMD